MLAADATRRHHARPRAAMLRSRAGTAAAFEKLEDRMLLAAIHWDGGGDGSSWSDAANWSGDALPGPSDHVLIGSDASVTLGGRSQRIRIAGLESHGSLTLQGGTLRATDHLRLTGSITLSAHTTLRAGAELRFDASTNAAGHSLALLAPDARFGSAASLLDLKTLRIRAAKELWFDGSATGEKLLLDGRGTARTVLTGSLDVSTSGRRDPRGSVEILGADIYLHGAAIDARGTFGAGEVRIGGDLSGGGSLPRAKRVLIDGDSRINASARRTGDGGSIIIWSDDHTIFEGTATAAGGRRGGDGGFIETSARGVLNVINGLATARGRSGASGLWLMDPYNVTIGGGANDNAVEIPGDPVTFLLFGDNAFISAAAINAALNNGTSVTVTTVGAGTQAGNLDVTSPITKTAGGNATLTLQASNNIAVLSPISSSSGQLNVILEANTGADDLDPSSGAVSIVSGAHNTNGGSLAASGVDMVLNVFAGLNTAGGPLTLSFSDNLSLDGTINAGLGALSISSTNGNISADTFLDGGTAFISAASGDVQVTQLTTTVGSATLIAGGSLIVGSSLGGSFSIATTLTASAATSGAGTLTFGNFMSVNANAIQLRAGDGPGGPATAAVNAISGNPVFRSAAGGATTPASFEIRQDASLSDLNLPGPSSFGGGSVPATLSYRSDQGSLAISTPAKVAGSALTVGTSGSLAIGSTSPNLAISSLSYSDLPDDITLVGNLDITAGNLSLPAPVTVENDALVSSSGSVSFLGPVNGSSVLTVFSPGLKTFGAAVGASFPLTFLGTSGGTTQLTASVTAGEISFGEPVTASGALTIRATAAGPTFSSTLDTGTGDVSIIGNDLQFLGGTDSISGSGVLTIAPVNNALPISIGGAAAFLSQSELDSLSPGFARVDLGSPLHNSAVTVNALTFRNPTRVLTNNGTITHQGISVIGGGGVTLLVSGIGGIVSQGEIRTEGGPIVLDGTVEMSASVVQYFTTDGGAVAGANITFSGLVLPGDGFVPSLHFFAGETGIVTLPSGLGDSLARFNSLLVFGGPNGAIRSSGDMWLGSDPGSFFGTESPFEIGADLSVFVTSAAFLNGLRDDDTPRSLTLSGSGDMQLHTVDIGGLDVTSTAGVVHFLGEVAVQGSLAVTGAARVEWFITITAISINFAGTVDVNGFDLELIADFLSIGGNFFGGGGVSTLTIAPRSGEQIISLNDTDSGLWLPASDLARLTDGFGRIIFGSLAGTSTLYIGNTTFSDPVEFRMAGPGGAIELNGPLSGTGNASFTFIGSGSTLTLNGNITTQSEPIIFNDAVEIGAISVSISTTHLESLGADITFLHTLDSQAGEQNSLNLSAGIGDITFDGEVGGRPGGELGVLFINSGGGSTLLNGGLIRTSGNQNHLRDILLGASATIQAGTGTLQLIGQVACGPFDLLLRADDLDLLAPVTGSGNLHISPFSPDRPVFINIAPLGPGSLTIDPSEKDNIQDGFESVTYGQEGQMSSMVIGGGDYPDPTIFVSNGAGDSSSVTVAGEITGTDNGGIRIRGGGSTTHLFASIRTQGNPIIIEDSVLIHVPGTVFDSTDSGVFPMGNQIQVHGSINSEAGEGNNFLIQPGFGQLELMGPIGAGPDGRLGSLSLSGTGQSILSGGVINTIGFQLYSGPVIVPVDLTLSTLNAPITFEDEVTGESNLTIDGGSGETTFGSESSFESLTIDFGSTRTFDAPVTIGTLTILGGTVFFNAPGLITDGSLVSGTLSGVADASFDGEFAWEGGAIEGAGLLIILPGGIFELDTSGQRTLARDLQVGGRLHWLAGNLQLDAATIEVLPDGVLEVSSSGTVTAAASSTGELVNNGRIERTAPGAGAFVGIGIVNNGVIDIAAGSIKFTPASGSFTNDGRILLGPAGSLIVRGGFVQSAAGSLTIRIAGTGTAQFGRLLVINSAALDGELTTQFVDGYAPDDGDQFQFLTAESRSGAFAAQNIDQPPGGLIATIEYLTDGARLIIAPMLNVDFNGDGERTVEDIFAYLSAWFAGEADFNGDGQTDVADIFAYLAAWFAD